MHSDNRRTSPSTGVKLLAATSLARRGMHLIGYEGDVVGGAAADDLGFGWWCGSSL
jgi:hypothetical protein